MPDYRSKTSTHGRNMAGARALWRATGVADNDFGKPIIAIANSFTQFVPGHVHLHNMGQLVAREIEKAGAIESPTAWNTWSMPIAPMRWCAFPTATKSPQGC